MQINFYFTANLLLLFYIWGLITFFVLFILKSRRTYFNLKELEKIFVHRQREWAKKNESFKIALNLNRNNLKNLLLSVFPLFFQGYVFYQWVRTGFNLTRRVLR